MAEHIHRPLAPIVGLILALAAGCGGAPTGDPTDSPTNQATPTPSSAESASLSVSAATVDFGTVTLGQSLQKTVQVQNTGASTVSLISVSKSGRNSEWFTVAGLTTLAPGASGTLTITFIPSEDGAASATLSVVTSPDSVGFSIRAEGVGGCLDSDGDGVCGEADCDEGDDDVYTGADEVCDGKDNDCDGEIDDNPEDGDTWYRDADNDGYGEEVARPPVSCEPPPGRGWITEGGDCDDTNPDVNEGAAEICDGVDNNCDRRIDEGDADLDGTPDCQDNDGDGFCEGAVCSGSATPGDCDDTTSLASPDLEEIPLDGVDNNCNGIVDENSLPTVRYNAPSEGSVENVLPGGSYTLEVVTRDAEDGNSLNVTIVSDIEGEVCAGASDATGIFLCSVSLGYGRHTLTASVTDSEGETVSATATLIVGTPPALSPIFPIEDEEIPFGSPERYTAQVTDPDPEQVGSPIEFVWRSDRSGVLAQGTVANRLAEANVTLLAEGPHVLTLSATDALGLESSVNIPVTVSEAACSMNRNLLALYHFDEGSGISAADSSGNSLSAEVSASWSPEGKFGSAVLMDGSSSFVKIPNTEGILSLSRFTVEAWVSFTTPPVPPTVVRQPILQKLVTEGGTERNYDLRMNPTGVPQIAMTKSSGGVPPDATASGTTNVARSTWYLMTATYDGESLKVYVNGEQDGTSTLGDIQITQGGAALYLGTDRFSGSQTPLTMNGAIDEVRILDCALLNEQIEADYRSGTANEGPAEGPTPTPGEDTPTPGEGTDAPTATPF